MYEKRHVVANTASQPAPDVAALTEPAPETEVLHGRRFATSPLVRTLGAVLVIIVLLAWLPRNILIAERQIGEGFISTFDSDTIGGMAIAVALSSLVIHYVIYLVGAAIALVLERSVCGASRSANSRVRVGLFWSTHLGTSLAAELCFVVRGDVPLLFAVVAPLIAALLAGVIFYDDLKRLRPVRAVISVLGLCAVAELGMLTAMGLAGAFGD